MLIFTGIKGASLNIDINLNEIEDKNYIIEKKKELNRIIRVL
jgi:formiminotetrahydrofolate cyclodeaminase